MCLSMAAFACNDMLTKLASQAIEPMQIMALRGVMASVLLIAIAKWRRVPLSLGILRERTVFLRALADICTTVCYISALRHLPLANASAIFQALPFAITIGAVLFLREVVGWRRWVAIGAGFVGVLVILNPGADGFGAPALWVLASVVFAAARDVITRQMPTSISSLEIASITCFAVMLTGFAFLPVVGWRPMTGALWLTLACAAVFISLGYALIVSAVRIGDMSFVAPFRYTILIFSMILGFLMFAERPTGNELMGSLIVVGSGLYTIHRERRVARAARRAALLGAGE